jgi:hypothetical protein
MWVRFSYYGHGYIDSQVLANIMTKSTQCLWTCFQDTQDADSVQWFAQILGSFIMFISTPTSGADEVIGWSWLLLIATHSWWSWWS